MRRERSRDYFESCQHISRNYEGQNKVRTDPFVMRFMQGLVENRVM